MKILPFFILLFTIFPLLSMEEKPLKTIQTKKIKKSYGFVTNFYESIVYSPDSQNPVCVYIQKKSISNQSLRDFLEENKDCEIVLVGPSTWMDINFSLIDEEKDDCCTLL